VFRETSSERAFRKAVTFVVKARLPSRLSEIVPLVITKETRVTAKRS
jgi:hypothetical protein